MIFMLVIMSKANIRKFGIKKQPLTFDGIIHWCLSLKKDDSCHDRRKFLTGGPCSIYVTTRYIPNLV